MNDPKRVRDGVATLDGGMDAGNAASLLQPNQAAFLGNMTVRGAYASTRPPYRSRVLKFDSDTTASRFVGIFQGSCFYEASDPQDNSLIVSIGGRLFRIWVVQNNLVTEITPNVTITVTSQFTVPAINSNVTVRVTTESPFTIGDTVYMDSGQYQVVTLGADEIVVKYIGAAAGATVAAGTLVLDSASQIILFYQSNPSTFDFVYLFQAENYVIVLCSQQKTIIFDGNNARTAGVGELPSGFVGVYAWGRIWIMLTNRVSFIAGDLVGSSSGTPQFDFIDAILKVTENVYLNGGGAFRIPANMGLGTSMIPLAAQDSSLGIGPILVGAVRGIVSVNAPVDRTLWQNLTYPIQSIPLLGYGPKAPRSFITANSDAWFRSEDGIRSLVASRRDFHANQGNTPNSFEVSPIINKDTGDLEFYESALLFENRLLFTTSPYRMENGGVSHRGAVVMNLDPVSTLDAKSPAVWEGLYTGINILQFVKGVIGSTEHAFIFSNNSNQGTELWEMVDDGYYDIYQTNSGITRTRVQSWVETRSIFGAATQLLKLITAELFLDEIVDNVTIVIKTRPDQYPDWITWQTIAICAEGVTQCSVPNDCTVFKTASRQYAARIMLKRPPETCNTVANMLVDRGYTFQFRIEITGSCRLRKFLPHAIIQQDRMEGDCPIESCETFNSCEPSWFGYSSRGN